jgi:hypothetical protein
MSGVESPQMLHRRLKPPRTRNGTRNRYGGVVTARSTQVAADLPRVSVSRSGRRPRDLLLPRVQAGRLPLQAATRKAAASVRYVGV